MSLFLGLSNSGIKRLTSAPYSMVLNKKLATPKSVSVWAARFCLSSSDKVCASSPPFSLNSKISAPLKVFLFLVVKDAATPKLPPLCVPSVSKLKLLLGAAVKLIKQSRVFSVSKFSSYLILKQQLQ